MNIWRFVCRSMVWWHLMIRRHWVRSQSWPQCGYSFFWITPVSPAARRALLFYLHSWFVLKQSRLNSVFSCPSKMWTYGQMLRFRWWHSGCRFEYSLISTSYWQKGGLQYIVGMHFISIHTAIKDIYIYFFCLLEYLKILKTRYIYVILRQVFISSCKKKKKNSYSIFVG